jgi:hypothetical protein
MQRKYFIIPVVLVIFLLAACKGKEVNFLSAEELHAEYRGNLQKFVLAPINLNEPEKNNVTFENFSVRLDPGSNPSSTVNITPSDLSRANAFNANVEMIFSGGFLNVPTQTRNGATISSLDGGLYVHSLRRLRYTIRVSKGDSTYLEVFEGIKP